MKKLKLNQIYHKKFHEVYTLEPNDLGVDWLTSLYRRSTSPLKSMPFFIIIPCAGIGAVAIYLLLGRLAIALVSVLQYGF